jgi:hypothetical protein
MREFLNKVLKILPGFFFLLVVKFKRKAIVDRRIISKVK